MSSPLDIYVKQLSKLNYGAPLFEPCDVQLGDVGFINTLTGSFEKFYHIADPPATTEPSPVPVKFDSLIIKNRGWGPIHVCTRSLMRFLVMT